MKLEIIDAGNLMCDGGAVFGVIPKVLWSKQYPANQDNFCNLAMRCLLIDIGDRRILIDSGTGNKQSEKFFSHYHLNGEATLQGSLKKAGYRPEEITDVVLTHLHFDHCGGVVTGTENQWELLFPNALHWVSLQQWNNFQNSNIREDAAHFPENMFPVRDAGKLRLISGAQYLIPEVELRFFNGHTPGQIIPFIHTSKGTIAYMGDLIPVMASIPVAWVSAYDARPVVSLQEKELFLNEAADKNYTLFFEHDLYGQCCKVTKTPKGIKSGERFSLLEMMRSE